MAGEFSKELEAFDAFAREQLDSHSYCVVADVLQLYHQRQEELERLRDEIRPALLQSQRGESKEVDFEQLKATGRQRLAEEGLAD